MLPPVPAVKFVMLNVDALTVPIKVEELPPTSRANVEPQ